MRKFSVVMVLSRGVENISRKTAFEECLKSLAEQDYPQEFFEVIAVDSGSLIDPAYLDNLGKKSSLNLRFVGPNRLNIGPARGRNLGVVNSSFDYVAFTDDDSIVPPDWLRKIDDAFERYPGCCAVGGLTLPPDGITRLNIFAYYERKIYLKYLKNGVSSEYISKERDEHPVFSGNIAYVKKTFLAAGGFDETFPPFVAGEDGDLKEKILSGGGVFVFVPVVVQHNCPYNSRRFFFQQLSRGASILRYRKKHGLENKRAFIYLRLFLAFFSLPVIFVKEKLDLRYSLISWLSLLVRNGGKLYYYEKI